jgi:glycosyltransferase involved in cell wall biosynthesis
LSRHYERILRHLNDFHDRAVEQSESAAQERDNLLILKGQLERSIESLEAELAEREAALKHAQKASDHLQSEYRRQLESAMRERKTLQETSAERIRILEADLLQRAEAHRSVQQQHNRIRLERDRATCRARSLQLYYLVRELEHAYTNLLDSSEWRLGNLVVRPLELLLLRWRKVLVTEELAALLDKARGLGQKPDAATATLALRPLTGQLRHGFDALFASRRWTLGAALTEPLRRLKGQNVQSVEAESVYALLQAMARVLKADPMASVPDTDRNGHAPWATEFPNRRLAAAVVGARPKPSDHNDLAWHPKARQALQPPPAPPRTRTPPHRAGCILSGERKPLVSILIPVYNKEDYVNHCLDSLLNTGLDNIEIVCIDDCSTDASKMLLKHREKKDRRIKVLALDTNSGASIARNLGLARATGKYICFADADDMLESEALSAMVCLAEEYGSDLVRGKITGFTDDDKLHRLAGEHLLHQSSAAQVVWRREESLWFYWYFTANLYRAEFLHEHLLQFPTRIRNEDPFFLCRCFLAAKSITLHNGVVYKYRIGVEQKSRTPSYSFLRGWAVSNYHISELIRDSGLPYQFFLTHLPSVDAHCRNIVKHLDREAALRLLRPITRMYSRYDVSLALHPNSQPWIRKRTFSPNMQRLLQDLKSMDAHALYERLLDSHT